MLYQNVLRIIYKKMNQVFLDCFVPRNNDNPYCHCEERSNPVENMNNTD